MKELRRQISELRNLVYILVHLLLMVVGGFVALMPYQWAEPLGLSLLAAGIAGNVIFVYVLVSRDVSDRLKVLREFGITDAFPARATRIQPEYEKRLAKAERHIDVLAFGLSALREDLGEQFPEWKRRAEVRILLIDPDFPVPEHSFAAERDREEQRPAGRIRNDVRAFIDHVSPLIDDRFRVRLYTCLPTINIFRVDDEILWGPYFVRPAQGRNTPTLVARKGLMYDALLGHFEGIWMSDDLSRPIPQLLGT